MSATDRRTRIVDAAVDRIADHGLRSLTHRALDGDLALPPGSTSYYFRTRRALLEAVAEHLTLRSREEFLATPPPEHLTPDTVARDVAARLDQLLTHRRNDLIARHALLLDHLDDPDMRDRLARSLFSTERATELFAALEIPDPESAAADFVAVVEGAVFDRFAGARAHLTPGTEAGRDQLTGLLAAVVQGLTSTHRPRMSEE